MERDGILVVGSTNMDMVVTLENFPKLGETILGKKFQTFPGGKGANQAVGVAKLGIKTYFITKMGNDAFKEKLSRGMAEDGVDINAIFVDPEESTGIAVIAVNAKGENEIMVVPGSNMKLMPEEIETKKLLFQKSRILLTQLEIPLETINKSVVLAKENEMIVILNPAPATLIPDNVLSMIDYLTPNETELEILTGQPIRDEVSIKKAAQMLLDKGVKNVIVTVGEKGAMLINQERAAIFNAKKVKAVDSTGAGDSFNAGLAYGLYHNFTLDDSIKFANVVAAISVTKMGAQSSAPTITEVMEFQ
ncbi:MAG: ribokinase [Ignavibacteriales bacterium]|nr:ribokinase [Ignavibacteriales bacterium]